MTRKEKAAAEATDRNVLTIRLPTELHEQLRAYKFFTDQPSINGVVVELIRGFLSGPGHEEIARGMTARAKSTYGEALDKLAGM